MPRRLLPEAAAIAGGVGLYWIAVHRMIGQPPLMFLLSTSGSVENDSH
jgi:hypothetical protein